MESNHSDTDFSNLQISLILIRRNALNYEAEQYDELLRKIGEAKGYAETKTESKPAEPQWTPDRIKWEPTQGTAGPYERSEDVNSIDFKTLLKDLATHQGKLSKDGYFYWTFRNGYTVGRKKRQNGDTASA